MMATSGRCSRAAGTMLGAAADLGHHGEVGLDLQECGQGAPDDANVLGEEDP